MLPEHIQAKLPAAEFRTNGSVTMLLRLSGMVLLLTFWGVRCAPDTLFAPDGARIDLAVSATQLGANGDSAFVTALATESDGNTVEDNTVIVFVATGGGLCEPDSESSASCASGPLAGVLTEKTTGGIAKVIFKSGSAGSATIKARSGSIEATTATITISSAVAPTGSKLSLVATPDSINAGEKAQILAFLSASDGAPLPDNTRVLFSSDDGQIGHAIGLTKDGFVGTTFVGTKGGNARVDLTSGTLKGETTVFVR